MPRAVEFVDAIVLFGTIDTMEFDVFLQTGLECLIIIGQDELMNDGAGTVVTAAVAAAIGVVGAAGEVKIGNSFFSQNAADESIITFCVLRYIAAAGVGVLQAVSDGEALGEYGIGALVFLQYRFDDIGYRHVLKNTGILAMREQLEDTDYFENVGVESAIAACGADGGHNAGEQAIAAINQ